jgi:hypothetical protein
MTSHACRDTNTKAATKVTAVRPRMIGTYGASMPYGSHRCRVSTRAVVAATCWRS